MVATMMMIQTFRKCTISELDQNGKQSLGSHRWCTVHTTTEKD